jgi:hypothetical protein
LKASGVVTGAAGKGNPVLCAKSLLQLQGVLFNQGQLSISAVLLLQFIHEVPEIRRQLGIFRAKVFLQPFADGAAYRSAGGTIDVFAALADSVGHCGFRVVLVVSIDIGTKSSALELFRPLIDCVPFA